MAVPFFHASGSTPPAPAIRRHQETAANPRSYPASLAQGCDRRLPASPERGRDGHGRLTRASPLAVQRADVHAVQCYEGTATLNQQNSGSNCTSMEKGCSNSSAGPLTHDGCTAAKADARRKLSARVQQSCQPYIQSNAPFTVININNCT